MKYSIILSLAVVASFNANALVFAVAGQGEESIKTADIQSYKQFIADNEFSASVRVFGWGGCSGTVVADHWVITAAHCPTAGAQVEEFTAVTEKGFTRFETSMKQENMIKETPWGVKNTWYIEDDNVDIVLMRLPEPFEGVVPAKIFSGTTADLKDGMDVVQCGYGGWNGEVCGTNKLSSYNDTSVTICMDRDVSQTPDGEVSLLTETPLETSPVMGDSGGGVYTYDKEKKELTILGVASGASGACTGYPSMAVYNDWVNKTIRENNYVNLIETRFEDAKFKLEDRTDYAASYSYHHADNANFEKTFFTEDGGSESVFHVNAGTQYQIEMLLPKTATTRSFNLVVEGYKVAKSIDVNQVDSDSVKIVVNTFTAPDDEVDIKVIPVLTEAERNDPDFKGERIVFDYVAVKQIN